VTPTEVASLLAALTALAGVIWTAYQGRKKIGTDDRASVFDEAMKLLDAKTDEVDRLERRLKASVRREEWRRQRERKLLTIVARLTRKPVDLVEYETFDNDSGPQPDEADAEADEEDRREARGGGR
jgi:hypothetical protein